LSYAQCVCICMCAHVRVCLRGCLERRWNKGSRCHTRMKSGELSWQQPEFACAGGPLTCGRGGGDQWQSLSWLVIKFVVGGVSSSSSLVMTRGVLVAWVFLITGRVEVHQLLFLFYDELHMLGSALRLTRDTQKLRVSTKHKLSFCCCCCCYLPLIWFSLQVKDQDVEMPISFL